MSATTIGRATDPRFWAKVNKTDGCWLWTGYRNAHGYGWLGRRIDGVDEHFLTHRYALMLAGVDLSGLNVDHICHTPACVRPDHLRLVTHKQNMEHRTGAQVNSKSGVRGVYWDKRRDRWAAVVQHHGRNHGRRFVDFAEAEAWVMAKRLELFTHNDVDRAAA